MRDNKVRSILAAGRSAIGTMVVEMRSPSVSILMANAGFDYMFLETKHISGGSPSAR